VIRINAGCQFGEKCQNPHREPTKSEGDLYNEVIASPRDFVEKNKDKFLPGKHPQIVVYDNTRSGSRKVFEQDGKGNILTDLIDKDTPAKNKGGNKKAD